MLMTEMMMSRYRHMRLNVHSLQQLNTVTCLVVYILCWAVLFSATDGIA